MYFHWYSYSKTSRQALLTKIQWQLMGCGTSNALLKSCWKRSKWLGHWVPGLLTSCKGGMHLCTKKTRMVAKHVFAYYNSVFKLWQCTCGLWFSLISCIFKVKLQVPHVATNSWLLHAIGVWNCESGCLARTLTGFATHLLGDKYRPTHLTAWRWDEYHRANFSLLEDDRILKKLSCTCPGYSMCLWEAIYSYVYLCRRTTCQNQQVYSRRFMDDSVGCALTSTIRSWQLFPIE